MSGAALPGRSIVLTVRGALALAGLLLALGVGLAMAITAAGDAFESSRVPAPEVQNPAADAQPEPPSSFAAVIQPLLDSKCSACHGERKQKAGLSLATHESILKGGRHGPAVNPSAPATSLMLARIELEFDHDKHMPPDDQDQLTTGELAALKAWILAGSPFQGVIDGVRADVASVVPSPPDANLHGLSPLVPADPAAIATLQAALVHVQPISQEWPLLWVDFAAVAKSVDDAKACSLLAPLTSQLCDVSLARTAIGDGLLALLAGCKSLRRLDLRATAVTDRGLATFEHHATLTELVLAQNMLSDAAVDSLIAMGALERVHLWHSGISPEGIARLRAARPELRIDDGASSDSAALEAESTIELTNAPANVADTAPAIAAPSLVPINTKCPVSGSPVNPKYSIVQDGRVIGFCCPNCPKEFWADPAKFADRLN